MSEKNEIIEKLEDVVDKIYKKAQPKRVKDIVESESNDENISQSETIDLEEQNKESLQSLSDSSVEENAEVGVRNEKQVIVKYFMQTKGQHSHLFTKSYPVNTLISTEKRNIERLLNVPFVNIVLKIGNNVLENNQTFEDFKTDCFGVLEVQMEILNFHGNFDIENIKKMYQHVPPVLPDVLTVQISSEDKGVYNVVVEVEDKTIYKPNLGGYEDAITGIEYHNAYSQTGPVPSKVPASMKNSRDTQTSDAKNKATVKLFDRSTQITSTMVYIPNINDVILTPRNYQTAEEKFSEITKKVVIIQKYYRTWKLKKHLKELRENYNKIVGLQKKHEEKEKLEDEQRRHKDLLSKAFPTTSTDFAMLHTMLERWKLAEIKRINAEHSGAAKIVEFRELLDKEIEILQSLDRIKQKVSKDIETRKIVNFFKTIGTPVEWKSDYKDIKIEMDTLETQKGRQYFKMYQSLCNKNLTKQEKLNALFNIKTYLLNHKCKEGNEILKLIERICTMISRGISKSHYEGFEERIQALLLHHFKQTQCNDGVTERLNKKLESSMEASLTYCVRCQKLKTLDMFPFNVKLSKVRACSACLWLDRVNEPWADLSPYRFMLKQIRKYEQEHQGTSSIVFILQEKDIYYIVDQIWHKRSALSEVKDVYDLRLVRWDKREEWTPWNCILLTNEESKAHLRIEELEEMYDENFRSQVFAKHALAKSQFQHLITADKVLEATSKK